MAILFGRELLTDYQPLQDMMDGMIEHRAGCTPEALEAMMPGIRETVVECFRDLDRRRLRAGTITYLSFRFQAWARGFDAEPSEPRRLVPAGVKTNDGNGPVVRCEA